MKCGIYLHLIFNKESNLKTYNYNVCSGSEKRTDPFNRPLPTKEIRPNTPGEFKVMGTPKEITVMYNTNAPANTASSSATPSSSSSSSANPNQITQPQPQVDREASALAKESKDLEEKRKIALNTGVPPSNTPPAATNSSASSNPASFFQTPGTSSGSRAVVLPGLSIGTIASGAKVTLNLYK